MAWVKINVRSIYFAVNFCYTSSCVANATCINDRTSHVCVCPSGFYGDKCNQGGK